MPPWRLPVKTQEPLKVENQGSPPEISIKNQSYKIVKMTNNTTYSSTPGTQSYVLGGYHNHSAGGGAADQLYLGDPTANLIAQYLSFVGTAIPTGDYILAFIPSATIFLPIQFPVFIPDGWNISAFLQGGGFYQVFIQEVTKT